MLVTTRACNREAELVRTSDFTRINGSLEEFSISEVCDHILDNTTQMRCLRFHARKLVRVPYDLIVNYELLRVAYLRL